VPWGLTSLRGKGGQQGIFIFLVAPCSLRENTPGGLHELGPNGGEGWSKGIFISESESLFDYSDPGKLIYRTKRGKLQARCHPAAQLILIASVHGAADPLRLTVPGGRPVASFARGSAEVKP
jgi:hypothetical protein